MNNSRSGNKRYKSLKSRRGAATVEFAFVAPVFFLFLFATIEFGRLALCRNALATASREGARAAVIEGASETDVIAIAESVAAAGSVSEVEVAVEYTDSTVTVTITADFEDVSWLPSAVFIEGQGLSCATTMRKESFDVTTYSPE